MTYSISELDRCGCEAAHVRLLKSVRIRTTERLLDVAKSPKGRKQLRTMTGINERLLLRWANTADRMRIKGVGKENAELLEAAGVNTVRELKYRNPAKLAAAMRDANRKRKLVSILPSEATVGRWIEEARRLPLKISY